MFGEHEICDELKYFTCTKENEINYVPEMKECGLFQDIEVCIQRLLNNTKSLILNMDNNLAEHYNSVVCKFVGGKRVNYSLKGSYSMRCNAAALSFNTGQDYYSVLYKTITETSPKVFTKKFQSQKNRRREYLKKRRLFAPRRSKPATLPDSDYGRTSEQIDCISETELENRKRQFLNDLEKSVEEIIKIEKETRSQASNPQWIQERSIRITASNFGKICKLRKTTSCANTVKNLLYSNFFGNASTKYGKNSEIIALQQLEVFLGVKIEQCGIFIDWENYFLGASPDGIIAKDHLVEIKCPSSIKDCTVEEGITTGKIKYATLVNNKMILKKNHDYYFQVQGQLAITRKDKCFFCVWTRKNFLVEEVS